MLYTYEEVLEQIESSHRFGNLPGVEVTERVLSMLGNPAQTLPFIHVAGTNGKGSTCAFLDQILRQMGLKVGCFTSPHLIDFCERITVNGKMIPRADVTRIGNRLLATQFGVTLTMFDYCLAMALEYFQEKKCDIAVIETGLGGRLDSTNAIGVPEISVITRIGYDHMAVLGKTLTDIAEEKAGILKAGGHAVFAPQEPEVMEILTGRMKELANEQNRRQQIQQPEGALSNDYVIVGEEAVAKAAGYKPGIGGKYQYENAAVAECAIWQMWERYQKEGSAKGARTDRRLNILQADRNQKISRQTVAGQLASVWKRYSRDEMQTFIQDGIHKASWPGRMEILSESPFFMVDGAHNSNGVMALTESLKALYPGERFHYVMGVMADKDYEEMVTLLLPSAIDIVTVTPESERALAGEALAAFIQAKGTPARAVTRLEQVLALPVKGERTIALGSLYFIGDVKRLWESGHRRQEEICLTRTK